MHTSPGGVITSQALPAGSIDDETLGPWIDVRGKSLIVFYFTSAGTTSGGVLSIEEAAPVDVAAENPVVFGGATGKYSVITTQNASGFTGDAQLAYHIVNANYYFIRIRISTAITGGGSVAVVLVAC